MMKRTIINDITLPVSRPSSLSRIMARVTTLQEAIPKPGHALPTNMAVKFVENSKIEFSPTKMDTPRYIELLRPNESEKAP